MNAPDAQTVAIGIALFVAIATLVGIGRMMRGGK